MFNINTNGNDDPARRNARAAQYRRESLIEHGQLGKPVTAPCAISPGTDKVTVQRIGAPDLPTTIVGLTAESAQGGIPITLHPADARRIAAALLDAADEADGAVRVSPYIPDTPGGLA